MSCAVLLRLRDVSRYIFPKLGKGGLRQVEAVCPKGEKGQHAQRGKAQGAGFIVLSEPGKMQMCPIGKVDKERKARDDEQRGQKPQIGLDKVNALIVVGQVQGHQRGWCQAVPEQAVVDPLDKGNRKAGKVQKRHE